MGHTPFLSILQRVAAEAGDGAPLTRRRLLKGAAMAGAASTVVGRAVLDGGNAWAAPAAGPQPRIAVIGGGISGMSAAMTLRDAGFKNVTVYEANTRLG